MHTLPSPHHLPSTSLTARLAPADALLPRRMAARSHDAAFVSPMELKAKSWVWHSRFGTIVIEVRGDDVFVDGDRVEPHAP